VENPAKQKSKKLLRTEAEGRERKNECVWDVEHAEVFISLVMCRKGKNEMKESQQQIRCFQFIQ